MTQTFILLISFIAPQYNISPEVAVAVARQESSLNPKAIGPLKEVGLFQVRPEFSKFRRDELFNPIININEGLRILSEAKRKCKHQLDRTWLNCYNLGIAGGAKIKHPKKFPYYIKVMNRIADAD
jgi:soluble lytic murein transglycosylase-like protein